MSRTDEAPGTAIEQVKIPPELLEKIEALPDAHVGNQPKVWTPEEDAIILRYWKQKRKADLAEILCVNEKLLRRRYRELIGLERR